MSYIQRQTVNVTTAADGSATAYSECVTGKIHSIMYVKDGSTPFDNGVDFAITTEETVQGLWTESNVNASKTVAPRQATHGVDGSASLYAAGGEPVEAPVAFANERIKIVIAQGGNAKLGRFYIFIE